MVPRDFGRPLKKRCPAASPASPSPGAQQPQERAAASTAESGESALAIELRMLVTYLPRVDSYVVGMSRRREEVTFSDKPEGLGVGSYGEVCVGRLKYRA
eukprot:COSAG02_NODE_8936_length_2393_cov_14.935920_3_plen_100_part_00